MSPRLSHLPGRSSLPSAREGARATDPAEPGPGAPPGPMDGHLGHLAQLATMASLLESLPDAVDDIRRWRRGDEARLAAAPVRRPDEAILEAYGVLDPLIRRAFDAVVAGLDKLADSAVDLCARAPDPPRRVEIEACAEIGAAMRQLLERALAIAESARPHNSAALPARYRELRQRRRSDQASSRPAPAPVGSTGTGR